MRTWRELSELMTFELVVSDRQEVLATRRSVGNVSQSEQTNKSRVRRRLQLQSS